MEKTLAMRYEDDFVNGAETVEIVFGIILAVGLGAALLTFQSTIIDAINNARESISATFSNLSSGTATAGTGN